MSVLSNVNVRRDWKTFSNDGLVSNVFSIGVENLHTAEISDFVYIPGYKWFVLRVTYGRIEQACKILNERKIQTYVPLNYVLKIINGKKKYVYEPLISNLVFIYSTRKEIDLLVKFPAPTAQLLKYYLNKTLPVEHDTGKYPPLIISDNDMRNFMLITSVTNKHTMLVKPEQCHYKTGDLVKIIHGQFEGVIGKVARVAGQQRVVVKIEGLCMVATAYIPSDFMIILPKYDRKG